MTAFASSLSSLLQIYLKLKESQSDVSSDVLTDLYEIDESLSGLDNEYDTEEFCLDFDLESTEMISDAESVILDEETSQDTGANNDPLEINYADYNMLPICVEQADEVAFTLDKLVKQGKIPKNGIFYKYLQGFLQVYVSPSEYSWDPEVIEFFKTLKWLGGQSTVNMIRGPMWHGMGRGGVFTPETMKPNLGGPSDRTLTKHSSGYTTESGIISPLIRKFQDLAVHAENDGTALKPSLQFDPTQKKVVGLASGNIDIDYIKTNKDLTPDLTSHLKQNTATEATVTVLTNSPKTSSLAVGVGYHSQTGKTGENLSKKLVGEVIQLQSCLKCLGTTGTLAETDCCEFSVCEACTEQQAVCIECEAVGQVSHLPCLRACSKCLQKNIKCSKCLVLTWSVDCESGNRKMADICSNDDNPNLAYLVVVPDTVHLGKTYKCSWSNWFLILGEGDRSSLATLRMLRNDSDPVVSEKLHKLLTAESVRNKDRMAVEPLLELTKQELLDLLESRDTIFVTMNLIPDRYRINDSNKRGLYSHPFAICTADTGKLVFLNWNPKTNTSDLVQLRLHSPAETVVLEKNIQTSGITLCYMNGVALFCGQEGILFHDIEGKL